MTGTPYAEITEHETNLANRRLHVFANDELGSGGAHHRYILEPPDGAVTTIRFQDGPIKEVGVNGATHEALLAIVLHRLRAFQYGDGVVPGRYACRENAIAITKLEEGLMWLQKRTQNREARGVEGTHEL